MSDYVLFTDSCCDLPMKLVEEMELVTEPLCVQMDNESYYNYLDEREISYKDFYARLPGIKNLKTSAINQQAFIDAMEPILAQGKDILYLGFSSGLSSTYASGAMAAQELQEKYPDRKIYTVDTLCASLGQGMLCYYAWLEKKVGKSIEEVRDFVEASKLHMCHWFTVDDLFHLKKGGRVSATTALLGSVLSIKPVMHMDNDGCLSLVGKARGRKASIKQIVQIMKESVIEPEKQVMFICHGGAQEDAEYLAELVRSEVQVKDIIINYVGPVIGAHSGPGTLALFFFGNQR